MVTSKDLSESEPQKKQIQELINLFNQGKYENVLSKIKLLIVLYPTSALLYNIQGAANAALQKNS